jgi:cytochrome c oxidase subunit 2
MNLKLNIFVFALGVSLLLVGAGCTKTTTTNSQLNNNGRVVTSPTAAVKSFTITAKQFAFSPKVITVNKGDTIKLTINSQDVEHSFSLPAFNLNVDLQPGQTKTVEFVASQTGSFTFACWVYCGDGHSDMVGKLIVQ